MHEGAGNKGYESDRNEMLVIPVWFQALKRGAGTSVETNRQFHGFIGTGVKRGNGVNSNYAADSPHHWQRSSP
jgi:hypothetical protein